MEFKEIKIYTTSEGIDIVTGALAINGLQDFVIEDAADFREFLETNTPRWDYIEPELMSLGEAESCVKLYLADNSQGNGQEKLLREVVAGIKSRDEEGLFGRLEIEVARVREEDWENNWKEYFKPFTVGDKFYIKPSWETIEDDGGRIVLEIDPASSFGTGTHATTQLCIEALEGIIKGGEKFCDLGCGSGILTLAAFLLGAGDLTAVDIDENAVRITGENLERNGAKARLFAGDLTEDSGLRDNIGTGYRVVAANIVADVLLNIMPCIKEMLEVNGKAILSGIISERKEEIEESVVKNGMKVLSVKEKDDWTCILAGK